MLSIIVIGIFLLFGCSKEKFTSDGYTQLVSDPTVKYHGNFLFKKITYDSTDEVAVVDTFIYHGSVQKYHYFEHVGVKYNTNDFIWMFVDTNGTFTFPQNSYPDNMCWTGSFTNVNELTFIYDSLPYYHRSVLGIRE